MMVHMARIQICAGEAELAIENLRKAMRLTPSYPSWYIGVLGWALVMSERFGEALEPLSESLKAVPDALGGHLCLAAAFAGLDREQEAKSEAQEILRISPKFSLREEQAIHTYKNPADAERFISLLRKAGLPE